MFFCSFLKIFLALYIWMYLCVQCLLFVQIVDGESSLGGPLMVPALFLSSSALECQLPVEDVQSAGVHHPPVTRWQIKVPVYTVYTFLYSESHGWFQLPVLTSLIKYEFNHFTHTAL